MIGTGEMKYICWYDDYAVKSAKLSDQELGRLLRACQQYHMTGEKQELAGREAIAYDFIIADIDKAGESYARKCEINAVNGSRGGRPRKSETITENRTVFSQTQKSQEQEQKQEQEQEQEQEQKQYSVKEKVCKRETAAVPANTRPHQTEFVPPTVDQVRAYCTERGNSVSPERFVDYYAACGWMVGKHPMRDWQAAVRTWENNGISDREVAKPGEKGSSDSSFDPILEELFENSWSRRTRTTTERTKTE